MEFVKRFSVILAVSIALIGCAKSQEKQISQLSSTVTTLEQQAAKSKEAISKLEKEVALANETISKMEKTTTQSIKAAVDKLEKEQTSLKADQAQSLAKIKATLTKLHEQISKAVRTGKPPEAKGAPKESLQKPATR